MGRSEKLTKLIKFMKDNHCFNEFKAELQNIGNEELDTIDINDNVFSNENYLQYDSQVTDINWGGIDRIWSNEYIEKEHKCKIEY